MLAELEPIPGPIVALLGVVAILVVVIIWISLSECGVFCFRKDLPPGYTLERNGDGAWRWSLEVVCGTKAMTVSTYETGKPKRRRRYAVHEAWQHYNQAQDKERCETWKEAA